MRYYADTSVMCPFYIGERLEGEYGAHLICEGVEGAAETRVVFRGKGARAEYKATFCCDIYGWRHCRVARMLNEKWRDLDEP